MYILILLVIILFILSLFLLLKWNLNDDKINYLEFELDLYKKTCDELTKKKEQKEKKMASKLGFKVYFMNIKKEKVEVANPNRLGRDLVKINITIEKGQGIIISNDDEKESIKIETGSGIDFIILPCNQTWYSEEERDKAIEKFYSNVGN